MAQKSETIPLQGGLDLISPSMFVTPGRCIAASNYEVEARGYRSMTGFERMDGRPAPSDAEYYVLSFDAGTTAISEDETVDGATSGASGIAVVDAVVESGSWATNDAAGYLVLYNVSGTFQNDEDLQVSAVTRAVADGVATRNGAATDTDHDTWIAAVTSKRRSAILQPTGSGAIRGVLTYGGSRYCFRDNAGGTAGQMFKESTAGWVAQTFGEYINFDAGVTEFAEGETLTGGTSAATATIERVVRNAGAWDGSAAGYLVLSGVTNGPFQNNEAITSATGAATADGANTAITLPAGGRYTSVEHNFYAQEVTTRVYIANGVGPALEWDGTVLAPVFTGLSAALEKPKFVAVHRQHLFLAYTGGSIQNSATGLPLVFDANQGAGEAGLGQDPTGLKSHTRDSLVITSRNKLAYLVGSDSTNFELKSISEDSGAIAYTLDNVGRPVFMDDQGIRDMVAAQTFGDWQVGTMTRLIEPLIESKRAGGTGIVGAMRVRAKDQYRLFYDDGTGIMLYFGRKNPEPMVFDLGITPSCFASGENASGDEILLMGSDDGWVYQVDKGTSFDGAVITAFLRTSFLNQGAPNQEKRYHRCRLEGQPGDENSAIAITADFSYGNPLNPSAIQTNITFYGGGAFWDEAFWNEFNWDAQIEGQEWAELSGIGENVSIVFASETATETPHTLSALTINFTARRRLR